MRRICDPRRRVSFSKGFLEGLVAQELRREVGYSRHTAHAQRGCGHMGRLVGIRRNGDPCAVSRGNGNG